MEICFEGVGQMAATFRVDGEVGPGMAVTLADSGTVRPGKDGDQLCGVALSQARGEAAAVQISGAARVSWSGAAPKAGWQGLACDGKGGVKTAAGGESWLVLDVDEDGKTAVIKL